MTLHRLLGWRPRQQHPLPPRPRQPAAVTTWSIVDETSMVVADADGPAARGACAPTPGWSWSATRPAHLRGGRRGARRPRRTASPGAPTRPCARCAPTTATAPRSPRWPRRCATATATALSTCCAAAADRSTFVEVDGPDAAADALRADLLATGHALRAAGLAGDAQAALDALDDHRLICAHRDGPHGVAHWNHQVERWLAEEAGVDHWPVWYAGRPLLVTSNDYGLGIYNGESGRRGPASRRLPAGGHQRLAGCARLRPLPPRRRRDDARADRAQEPGQPGASRSRCCCRPRTPGC